MEQDPGLTREGGFDMGLQGPGFKLLQQALSYVIKHQCQS